MCRRPCGCSSHDLNGHLGRHHTANSGERRGLCAIARGTKEQKPPFSFFFPASVPWGLLKSTCGAFFCVFLCRPGPRSCGYFHAEMRRTWRTAKPDRSKPARSAGVAAMVMGATTHGPRPQRAAQLFSHQILIDAKVLFSLPNCAHGPDRTFLNRPGLCLTQHRTSKGRHPEPNRPYSRLSVA